MNLFLVKKIRGRTELTVHLIGYQRILQKKPRDVLLLLFPTLLLDVLLDRLSFVPC